MAIAAFLPLAFFVAIAGSVGFRLVRLWTRTHSAPEGSLGLGLLLVASSMPLSAIGRVPDLAMHFSGRVCFSAGLLIAAVGLSGMVFFNYQVFRRGSVWGRLLFVAISGLLLASVSYMSVANFRGNSVEEIKPLMRPGTLSLMGAVLLSFLWGAAESFRCRYALKRQLALGLGDPVVANRFLLWGVASVACACLLVVIIACVVSGMTIMQEPVPLGAMSVNGIVMSAAWYFTFFAPARYLRFVRESFRG